MSYFITSDNCRIYYEEYGSGEPLIFIHGWACSHKVFKYQIEHFSKSHRVIVYDLRGHGSSDRSDVTERNMTVNRFADDLRELILHLNIKRTCIAGWSLGTTILLCYARKYKCLDIDKMCFIDMTPKLLNDHEWSLGHGSSMTMKKNLQFLSSLVRDWESAAKRFAAGSFARDYDTKSEEYKWFLEDVLDNTPHCMINSWISLAAGDYRKALPFVKVPVLLAYGGNGLMCTPEHGEYMKDNLGGNSQLIVFHDCGHCLFLEDPSGFNKALSEFLTNS